MSDNDDSSVHRGLSLSLPSCYFLALGRDSRRRETWTKERGLKNMRSTTTGAVVHVAKEEERRTAAAVFPKTCHISCHHPPRPNLPMHSSHSADGCPGGPRTGCCSTSSGRAGTAPTFASWGKNTAQQERVTVKRRREEPLQNTTQGKQHK